MQRRLLFRGYPSGLSNNRLALDIGVGLAHLTGRVLVPYRFSAPVRFSPPNLDGEGRAVRPLGSIFDLFDVPVEWVPDHLAAPELEVPGARKCLWEPVFKSLFYYPATLPIDVRAFEDFRNGRQQFYTFDAETEAAGDVQVDTATLGLYSHFFFLDERRRADLVRVMGRIRPKAPYAALADRVAAALGSFNAIHLRRGDFVRDRFTPRVAEATGGEVARNLLERLDRQEPLVICTDDSSDRAFFDPLRREFPRSLFLDRLLQESAEWRPALDELPHNEDTVLSLVTQLVAERARTFAGTLYSTFTSLIHRARGFAGRDPSFLFCYADWPPGWVRYERCEYLPNGSGRWSWNRTRFPVGAEMYSWFREWPEAYTAPAPPAEPDPEPPAGTLVLDAAEAAIHGTAARLVRDEADPVGHVGFWTDPRDHVDWELNLGAPRRVRVEVRYACPPQCAGSVFRVGADGARSVEGTVGPTPAWSAFSRWEEVGEMLIPPGRRRLWLRAHAMPHGAVMDLAGLRLVPLERH